MHGTLPIQICNPKIYILCECYIIVKPSGMIFDIDDFLGNYKCKNSNVKSSNCSDYMKNSMKCLEFLCSTLNQGGLGNSVKMCCTWSLTNLQKNFIISKIILSAIKYTFPTIYNIFPIWTLCNDIATLLSIASLIHVLFLRKYRPILSQRKL